MSKKVRMTDRTSPSESPARAGRVDAILAELAWLYTRRPWAVLAVMGVLTIVAAAEIALDHRILTGRDQLTRPGKKYSRDLTAYKESFGSPNAFVLVVSGGSPRERTRFLETFAAELVRADGAAAPRREDRLVRDVLFRQPLEHFRARGLYYIDAEELQRWADGLGRGGAAWLKPAVFGSFPHLLAELSHGAVSGVPVGGPEEDFRARALTALLSKLTRTREQAARMLDRAEPGGEEVTLNGGLTRGLRPSLPKAYRARLAQSDGYLASRDGTMHMAVITPARATLEMDYLVPLNRLVRRVRDRVRSQFPDLAAGLTGYPALIHDETRTIGQDLPLTSVVALAGVSLVLFLGLRPGRHVIAVVATLAMSVVWTLGAVFATVGHLNAVTAVIVAILFGLGIDFGIHLLVRLRDEGGRAGTDEAMCAALARTLRGTGRAIGAGGLTSAAAFFALATSEFLAFAELGVIAGMGLLLCMAAMLSALPCLLWILRTRGSAARMDPRPEDVAVAGAVSVLQPLWRRRGAVVFGAGLLTLGAVGGLRWARFDYNMQNLQAAGTEAVATSRLLSRFGAAANTCALTCTDLQTARAWTGRLQRLPEVDRVESAALLVPPDLEEKQALLGELHQLLTAPVKDPPAEPQEVPALLTQLAQEEARPEIRTLAGEARSFVDRLGRMGPLYVNAFGSAVTRALARRRETLLAQLRAEPPALADFPPSIRRRYLSRDGERHAVLVHPAAPIWDREALGELVAALRTVDPDVTGFPVAYYEITGEIRKGFGRAAILAAGVVLAVLLLDLRSLRHALLAAVPVGIGVLWMVGLMGAAGIPFNLANVVVVPLILGIGIDNGIHIVHRFREEEGLSSLGSTVRALTLTGLTSMAGFGALVFASHRGLQSLGWLMVVGLVCCWVAAVVLLPALLALPASEEQSTRR